MKKINLLSLLLVFFFIALFADHLKAQTYNEGEILLKTSWSDTAPFNIYYPMVESPFKAGEIVSANLSCSILSFGQIFNYHQIQPRSQFLYLPEWPVRRSLSAIDWKAFERHFSKDLNQQKASLVDRDIRHMGDVMYDLYYNLISKVTPLGTASYVSLPHLLRAYKISPEINMVKESQDFFSTIKKNIDQRLPLVAILEGIENAGEHAFVIDGYKIDDEGQMWFHVNNGNVQKFNTFYRLTDDIIFPARDGFARKIYRLKELIGSIRPCDHCSDNGAPLEEGDTLTETDFGFQIKGFLDFEADADSYELKGLSGEIELTPDYRYYYEVQAVNSGEMIYHGKDSWTFKAKDGEVYRIIISAHSLHSRFYEWKTNKHITQMSIRVDKSEKGLNNIFPILPKEMKIGVGFRFRLQDFVQDGELEHEFLMKDGDYSYFTKTSSSEGFDVAVLNKKKEKMGSIRFQVLAEEYQYRHHFVLSHRIDQKGQTYETSAFLSGACQLIPLSDKSSEGTFFYEAFNDSLRSGVSTDSRLLHFPAGIYRFKFYNKDPGESGEFYSVKNGPLMNYLIVRCAALDQRKISNYTPGIIKKEKEEEKKEIAPPIKVAPSTNSKKVEVEYDCVTKSKIISSAEESEYLQMNSSEWEKYCSKPI
jgi:hypothetical protein